MTSRLCRFWTVALLAGVLVVAPAGPGFADQTRDGQWMIDALNLEKAWETTKGEGVTVGIVDTGVDATHPDIENNVLPGISVLGEEPDPADEALTDPAGHGTAMASLIAGHGHGTGGQDGIIGVAPEAKVLSVRGTEYGEEGEWPTPTATEDGIRWLADNGADVILLAYGGRMSENEAEREAIQYAAIDRHIPVIASAGNTEQGANLVDGPAAYEEVLAISGTTKDNEFWTGSAQGDVALAAPAENIAAADKDQRYKTHSGTSRSSAIAAGVMALLKAQYPDATRMELYWRIAELADDAGQEGCDDEFGCGIVNPVAALTEDPGPLPAEMQDPKPLPADEDSKSGGDSATELTATTGGGITLWITIAALVTGLLLATAVVLILTSRIERKHAAASDGPPPAPQTATPPAQSSPPQNDTAGQRPNPPPGQGPR